MTGVHAASFWVGGTVPGYAWGEGKGERAAVRSKKFKRGRFRDSVYQYRRMFLCPSIFPLLLQSGVLGRVDFDNTGIGRLYAETCGEVDKMHRASVTVRMCVAHQAARLNAAAVP